jgi:hypothetical protein
LLIVLTLFVRAFAGTPGEPRSAVSSDSAVVATEAATDAGANSSDSSSAPDPLDDDGSEEPASLTLATTQLLAPTARSAVFQAHTDPPKIASPPLYRPPRFLQS